MTPQLLTATVDTLTHTHPVTFRANLWTLNGAMKG